MTHRRFSWTRGLLVVLCILALCGKAAGQAAQPVKGDGKNTVAAKTGFSTGLQALLDDILKADDKWKTEDVMELVSRLQMFREELADYPHLPNLEALKGKIHNDHIVQVLDLYYRYSVHKAYQAVEKDIEKIDGWNNDSWLVLLAIECVIHIDSDNFEKQLVLARRLVELEPENKKFRKALEWTEQQLPPSKRGVQPRQKKAPAQEQQAK